MTLSTYTASNQPRSCPAVQSDLWLASDSLPPTPNATLCELMVESSSCVPSDTLASDATKIGAMFGTICGLDATACKGIASNATAGTYGAFSMCNATQQLANAMNAYYMNQKKASSACDFDGQAKVVTPTVSAGSLGTGSSGSSGSSGSGSGSSVSSPSGSPSSNSSSSSSGSSSNGSSSSGAGGAGTGGDSGTSSSSASPTSPEASSAAGAGAGVGAGVGASASASNSNNATSDAALASSNGTANTKNATQSGSSSAAGRITMAENAGWAGSLLVAVGIVALGL